LSTCLYVNLKTTSPIISRLCPDQQGYWHTTVSAYTETLVEVTLKYRADFAIKRMDSSYMCVVWLS